MSALLIEVPEAVVQALKTGPLSQYAQRVTRIHRTPKTLTASDALRACVLAISHAPAITANEFYRSTVTVQIFLLKKLTKDAENAEFDPLVTLAEEVCLHLLKTPLDGGNFHPKSVINEAIYDPQRITELGEFFSVIKAVYEVTYS